MAASSIEIVKEKSNSGFASRLRSLFSRNTNPKKSLPKKAAARARARRKESHPPAGGLMGTGPNQKIENRVTVAEALWGKGFSSPCGSGLIEAMIQPLGLEPGQEILEIGTGIGGGATLLSEKYGVQVTALEKNEEYVEYLNFLRSSAPLGHPVSFAAFDPVVTEFNGRTYHATLIKDVLFQIADKENFLKRIKQAGKTHAHLAVCDFVLAENDVESESVKMWMAQESIEPHPISVGDTLWNFRVSGFHPVTQKDITNMYLDRIRKALPQIQVVLATIASSNPPDKGLARALLDEATLWLTRAAALETGAIRVYYFHAVTKELSRKLILA